MKLKIFLKFENNKKFKWKYSNKLYSQDKLEYNIKFNNNKINISSPNKKKTNFNINSKIQLNPFYFEWRINNKK